MNILILSIFNETQRNNELLKIQRKNLIKNEFIDYYFITYDENQSEDFRLVDDMLFIKGKEHFMNILDKTLKSIRYFINIKQYDFIIRTNISTVLNYKLLYNHLNNMPKNKIYSGGVLFDLQWLDEKFGITDNTIQKYELKGLYFFQGTCIVLSRDIIEFMLANSTQFIHELIDDVSIGLFIKTYLPSAYELLFKDNRAKYSVLPRDKYNYDNIVIRIKSFNDENDIKIMNEVFSRINSITDCNEQKET
jgi:hypothetical protein